MKKIYLSLIISFFICKLSLAQTIILSEDFNSFDATSDSTYHGWFISYYGANSFYTSQPAPAGSAGPSGPNTYKFGRDSATAITPMFTGADSVHFFMKGNPPGNNRTLAQSTFYVYESTDSINWNPLHTFSPPMDTTKTGYFSHFQLGVGTKWLKFFYDKDSGNIAFDDFSITSSTVSINTLSPEQRVKIYPTPTNGKITVNFGTLTRRANFSVINMLGKQVLSDTMLETDNEHMLNLSALQDGIYFLKIKSDQLSMTKRIIVKR